MCECEVEENQWYDDIEVTTSRAKWRALCRDGLENYDDVKTRQTVAATAVSERVICNSH